MGTFNNARVKLTATTETTIYTCPEGVNVVTRFIQIVNDSSTAVNAGVWIKNGGAKVASILSGTSLAAASGFKDTGLHYLEYGDSIVAQIDDVQDVYVEVTVIEGV
jgi:predicted DNA-binding protein